MKCIRGRRSVQLLDSNLPLVFPMRYLLRGDKLTRELNNDSLTTFRGKVINFGRIILVRTCT